MSAGQVRALEPEDAVVARKLVQRALGGSRHASRVFEQLDVAITGADAECVAFVLAEHDQSPLRGVVLFGPVAGANGVIKIHALVGMDRDAMVILVDGLTREPGVRAARMIVCEIADDPTCAMAASAMLACGFTRDGRVEDFFADGVNLDLLVRRR